MRHAILLLLLTISLPAWGWSQACDLLKAIRANEPTQVQACIDAHADLGARDASGRTPLLTAIASEGSIPERQKKIVTALLTAGADANAADNKGYTALHYAAYQGMYDLVGLLLEHGASIDALNPNQESPLLLAARGPLMDDGRLQTFERLLAAKADVRQADSAGRTALHLLCAHKPRLESPADADAMILQLAQKLEALGAAIKSEDAAGNTPFANAIRQGHAGTAMWLIAKGASVMPEVLGDFTALHIATERGQVELIDQLLRSGIDINRQTASKHQGEDAAYFYPKGSTPVDICLIIAHESKDPNRQKGYKALANSLAQRGGISRTYEEYVQGFKVMKGGGAPPSSKTGVRR